MRPWNVAAVQIGGINESDTRTAVVERLCALLSEASDAGADFVVFPELTLTTFFPRTWVDSASDIDKYFEKQMPGPQTQSLFDLAKERGVGFYIGYAEMTDDGKRFNTSIVVDKSGDVVGKYRKMHLPGHSENLPDEPNQHLEKKYFEEGDLGFPVFEVDGVRVGMCLCNDRRWPEVYRVLALQGAEVVVLGYNTPDSVPGWFEEPHAKMFTHLLSLQANAYQNAIHVVAAGKSGFEDGHHMIGGSAVVAPSGEILSRALGEGDEVVQRRVDLDSAEPYRNGVFNFAKHRRPEAYGLITMRKGIGEPLTADEREV